MNRRAPVDVLVFRVPGAPLPFAVDRTWESVSSRDEPVDVLAILDLARPTSVTGGGVLSLRRRDKRCAFAIQGTPFVAPATRFCAPPEGWGVEVVALAESEALLINPEVLLGPDSSV
jgi:hypothetical protein